MVESRAPAGDADCVDTVLIGCGGNCGGAIKYA
jgi:hypothetical protein